MKLVAGVLLVLVVTANAKASNWTSHGPDGGNVSALASSPTNRATVFAGVAGGIYVSHDNGASWSAAGRISDAIASIAAVDDLTVYVATRTGYWRSREGGQTWESRGKLYWRFYPWVLVADRTGALYHLVQCNGGDASCSIIYKSTDGAQTWTPVFSGDTCAGSCVAIDSAGALLTTINETLSKSTDGGITWQKLPMSGYGLAVAPSDPNTIYVGKLGGGVSKTIDGGMTFTTVPTTSPTFPVAVDASDPNVLYATSGGSYGPVMLVVSDDGGTTFQPRIYAPAAATHTNNGMLVGGFAGVLRTTDGGKTFMSSNRGIRNAPVLSVATDPVDPLVAYAVTSTGVFRTDDQGESWEQTSPFYFPIAYFTSIAVAPSAPTRIYLAGYGLLRSDDAGMTWSTKVPSTTIAAASQVLVDPAQPDRVFVAAWGDNPSTNAPGRGALATTDGFTTFALMNDGLTRFDVMGFAFDPSSTAIVYAAADSVSKSVSGAPWTPVSTQFINDITPDPERPGTFYSCAGYVQRSTDGGASWTSIAPQLNCRSPVIISPELKDSLFVADNTGVSTSTDGGSTWSPVGVGFPVSYDPVQLALSAGSKPMLYAATRAAGVWTIADFTAPQSPVDTPPSPSPGIASTPQLPSPGIVSTPSSGGANRVQRAGAPACGGSVPSRMGCSYSAPPSDSSFVEWLSVLVFASYSGVRISRSRRRTP